MTHSGHSQPVIGTADLCQNFLADRTKKHSRLVLVFSAIWLFASAGGCASNAVELATIAPENARTSLAVGDEIHVIGKDRSFTSLIVAEVNDREIVGEQTRILLDEVESITLMGEEDGMGPATTEGIAWLVAIAIWIAVLR